MSGRQVSRPTAEGAGMTDEERDELTRLRTENGQLRYALQWMMDLLPGQVPDFIQEILHERKDAHE